MGERRQQIEDVASALFGARGYAGTSMRDIARGVDLQGGSLYAHVTSKQDVLWAIVERAAEQFRDAVRPIVVQRGPAPQRLRGMVRAHVGVVTGSLDRASVFLFEWGFLEEPRRSQIARRRDQYEGWFRSVIAAGSASGELAVHDPKLAAIFLLSALNGLARWYRADGPVGPDLLADRYAELAVHGLAATGPVTVRGVERPVGPRGPLVGAGSP